MKNQFNYKLQFEVVDNSGEIADIPISQIYVPKGYNRATAIWDIMPTEAGSPPNVYATLNGMELFNANGISGSASIEIDGNGGALIVYESVKEDTGGTVSVEITFSKEKKEES